ncbi:MAG TPA: sugar transferase [Frankiaceae bacterium]|nr:sugar transferase [Frankiaceae bacterium]
MTEAPPQPRTAFVDRRKATQTPMPNPGRRASDRAEYLAELARRTEVRDLSGTPDWLRRYARGLIAVDLVGSLFAATLALAARFGDNFSTSYLVVTLLFPLGFVTFAGANRGYEPRFLGAGADEYRRSLEASLRYGAVIAIVAFALGNRLARGYLFLALPLATVIALTCRRVARDMLGRARREGSAFQHRVIVAGTERAAAELIRQVRRHAEAGFEVVAACVTRCSGRTIEGVPVIGTSAQVVEALRVTSADTVAVAAWSDFSQSELRRLSWRLEGSGVTVVVAPQLTDIAGPRIHIRPVAGLPLLHIEQPEFRGARRIVKATIDRSVALIALLMLSPLILGIAAIVRLTSRGPALFRQVRVGAHGSHFTMFKFRSMRSGAEREVTELAAQNENSDGLLFKMREDPRVTSIGKWIRRFSLDELPQLLNVVLGQMSLVGPRPPLPSEVERYGGDVSRRLLVKPGLTGLWQISGRSELPWDEAVRLDLHYVENWSLALDFLICWRTFAAVLRRRGAY